MNTFAQISNIFIVVLSVYVLSTLLYCLSSIFEKKVLSALALRVTLIGLVLQIIGLLLHWVKKGYPFITTSFDTFQMVSLGIVGVFVMLCFFYRFFATGVILMPIALIVNILSLTHFVHFNSPGHFLENPWAFVHLVFVFLSIAFFLVSFVVGFIYLVQEYRIKHKRSGGIWDRFPSLETMDMVHYRALYTGFIFFTVGIITGGGWSKSTTGMYVSNNLKQLVSFGAWIFFAIFLNLRVAKGWMGRKGIILSSLGLISVIFLFLWVQK